MKALVVEIEVLSDQPNASELDISNLEISIFTGFFLTRKLIEAHTKISPKTARQNVRCKISNKRSDAPRVDVMNRFDTHELYDLEAFEPGNRSLQQMCNLFIHSVFMWMVYEDRGFEIDEAAIIGVHLTSSHDKEKSIFWVEIVEIIRVFSSIIQDKNNIVRMSRDPDNGEMKVDYE